MKRALLSAIGLAPADEEEAMAAQQQRKQEEEDVALAQALQAAEEEDAASSRGRDRGTRSGRKAPRRQSAADATLARSLHRQVNGSESEDDDDDDNDDEYGRRSSAKKKKKASAAAAARSSVTAERAALVPFARNIDRSQALLELVPSDGELLVSATTYRVLQWGLGGHREQLLWALGSSDAELHELAARAARGGEARVAVPPQVRAAHRAAWEQLPICVPQVPPREGCVYVTHEAVERIAVGSELYHRIYIEEGALPKQIGADEYESRVAANKESERAGRADRKKFGATAALGIRLQTIKTSRNGDCFFDALCKAFSHSGATPTRAPEMRRTAAPLLEHGGGGGGSAGGGSGSGGGAAPLTIRELRAVVAAHFPEEAWLIGQAVGGESFSFIVDDSFDLTKANVAALAEEAADRAYWADESAIAILQRYLGVRLLIYNPDAAERNRCNCLGEVPQQHAERTTFVLLCHTHRTSKVQHYELYAKPAPPGGKPTTLFDEATLPSGVKRAFASVCPEANASWKTAAEPGEGSSSHSS